MCTVVVAGTPLRHLWRHRCRRPCFPKMMSQLFPLRTSSSIVTVPRNRGCYGSCSIVTHTFTIYIFINSINSQSVPSPKSDLDTW